MKKVFLLAMIVILAACSQTRTEETIRKEISDHKQEISNLNKEIVTLEDELKELLGDNKVGFRVPVEVKNLTMEPFNHFFEVSGTVEAINAAFISPETSGQLKEIYVVEGQQVKKGQLLARLNTDITSNSIKELESSLEHATTVYEKQKRLWEKGIGSELQYLNAKNSMESVEKKLETLKSQQEMSMMRSPVNGVVDEIFLKEGELAMPGMQLMQVVDLTQLYINADVSESYISSINVGDPVEVRIPSYPEMSIAAPVHRLGNVINANNRTFKMQLKINNSEGKLKPNILAVVKVNDFSTNTALVVPSRVIKQDMQGPYLYKVANNDDKLIARKVYINTGMSYKNGTVVTDGLNSGDQIIVRGDNQVSDGSRVLLND